MPCTIPSVHSTATMPKRQKITAELALDLTPSSLHLLKRAQLQQHCKKLGLRGGGKNTELVQRLQEYFTEAASSEQQSPRTPPPDRRDDTREEQPGGRGWCVVHGQELTIDRWYPLSLRCGRVCVTSSGSYISLHLVPSSMPTPPGLTDNLICGVCMERNGEKESRLLQKSVPQERTYPHSVLQKSVGASRSCKSGRFHPQEDPEYARRVDELLDQMAMGHVDSEKVLQPFCPAVVHSPLGKQESSPVPI
ncbi:developmental pluripotency-associated protein 4 isoform X2 [Pseudophryne corroboree]|uniref:developmental pluripotency-associated protein 4 isoform X2 n=1 Tax=Pseudophryne corroboree TaxID=495146 RepID=UPI0030818482